jgi:hypothetical protein
MRKQILVSSLIVLSMVSALSAQQSDQNRILLLPPFGRSPEPAAELLGNVPTPELLSSIVSWLSKNFDLPATHEYPRVVFVPQEMLAVLSQRKSVSADQARNIVALYDDVHRTIYLQEGWSARPAEFSVLVHEMVHHLQNVAQLKYDCPQAREELAFKAQEGWLTLSGLNLMDEFEIDAMTIFIRSACLG